MVNKKRKTDRDKKFHGATKAEREKKKKKDGCRTLPTILYTIAFKMYQL